VENQHEYGGTDGEATDHDVDSELSFDHESIFSVAGTVTTNTSFSSGESDDSLIQELANFLWEDPVLRDLYSAGLQDVKIGRDRFQRNFRRLLKLFALGLKREATRQEHFRAARFVSNQSGGVSREICLRVAEPQKTQQIIKKPEQTEEGSSDESEDEGVGDDPTEDEEYSLSQVKQFMLTSFALVALRENLRNFVRPTFQPKFRELLRATKETRALPQGHVQESWIRTCISEVQSIDPTMIEVSRTSDDSLINKLKIFVEKWTRERWDWWPLSPAQHPLNSGQARLKWTCVSIRSLSVKKRRWRTSYPRTNPISREF
jgi:hypothetical protein